MPDPMTPDPARQAAARLIHQLDAREVYRNVDHSKAGTNWAQPYIDAIAQLVEEGPDSVERVVEEMRAKVQRIHDLAEDADNGDVLLQTYVDASMELGGEVSRKGGYFDRLAALQGVRDA